MKDLEAKASKLSCVTKTFRSDGKTLEQLEKRFREKANAFLFEDHAFSFNETCFCMK